MRIIARKRLREFGDRFPDANEQLSAWWFEANAATWKNHADVKAQYRSASLLKKSRVVFNICGNKYRLIVRFDYEMQLGFIRFVGTHKEYDKINAEEV
ncbi:MAG: type II toxin-antitoxin system HigB family toxin [Pikeienuella sp.]